MRKTSKRLSSVLLGSSHSNHHQTTHNWQLDSSSWEFLGTGNDKEAESPSPDDEDDVVTTSPAAVDLGAPSPYENMFNSDCLSAIEASVQGSEEDTSSDYSESADLILGGGGGEIAGYEQDIEKIDVEEGAIVNTRPPIENCTLNDKSVESDDRASLQHSDSKGTSRENAKCCLISKGTRVVLGFILLRNFF